MIKQVNKAGADIASDSQITNLHLGNIGLYAKIFISRPQLIDIAYYGLGNVIYSWTTTNENPFSCHISGLFESKVTSFWHFWGMQEVKQT